MFRYIFRVFCLLGSTIFKQKKLSITDTSILKWRVWPRDLDFNFHLNNGAALTIMDFGRYDLIIRMGMLKLILKEKLQPIVGSTLVKFRHSIPAFAICEIHTTILCWDEKWIYFDQKYKYKDRITGQAYHMTLMRDSNGSIAPDVLAEKMGIGNSPPMPEVIQQWKKLVD